MRHAAIFLFFIILIFIAALSSSGFCAVSNLVSSGGNISFEIIVERPELVATGGGLRVLVNGYGTFSPPGAVEIPGRIFNVAVPPGSNPLLRTSVVERQYLGNVEIARAEGSRLVRSEDGLPLTETYLPEDPWKGKGLPPVISAGDVSMMGRVPVLPVRVNLLGRDEGGYWIARRITVSINAGGGSRNQEARSPGMEIISRDGQPLSAAWRGVYGRVLVNPDDAAAMVKPVKRVEIQRGPAAGRRLKIRVPETGLFRLEADSLAQLTGGGPIDGIFALKRYYYDEAENDLLREVDIPYLLVKGSESSPNYFEEDDVLYFYAKGIRDDPEAGDPDAAFTDNHLVWLVEGEAGEFMTGGAGRSPASAAPESYFIHEEKVRKDTYYQKDIKAGSTDYYFVSPPGETETVGEFHCRNIYPGALFSVKVLVRGYRPDPYNKSLIFELDNSSGRNQIGTGSLTFDNELAFQFDSNPSDWLVEGDNSLIVREPDIEYAVMINEFSVSYPRRFVAVDGMLHFTLQPSGSARSLEIEGFEKNSGYLIDITDPSNPVTDTLSSGLFTGPDGNGKYKLSLELPADIERSYVAFQSEAGTRVYNSWLTLDTPSGLKEQSGIFNSLVISHEDFLPPKSDALADYLQWRESQGYRILTAGVQDVYDEFNGGLPSYHAVKRFIKYGFEHYGAEFVMLVGDASEDHKRLFLGDPPDSRGSPPDFVPAYTYSMSINAVGYRDEVVATDKWYSFIDDQPVFELGSPESGREGEVEAETGERNDFSFPAASYPDVFVGRVPVGSDLEAGAVFLKLKRYEEISADDQWRRNFMLFADDAWSGSSSTYTYRSSEERFESSMDSVASRIERDYRGGMRMEKLYLSKWTENAHPAGESSSMIRSVATDSTRTYFSPYLIDRLNEGCLFWVFQGHASRNNLSTEAGFSMYSQYRDVNRLFGNRNNIFVGLGCHISEFAYIREHDVSGISGSGGDCISEQLFLKGGSGSIAAYASCAYEDLIKNANLCENIFEVVFSKAPSDSMPPLNEATGTRWILGELMTAAEIEHIATRSYGYEQVFRYVLFGDPMQRIDTGPPVMKCEVDWGDGWEQITSDTLNSQNRDNTCDLRFTVTDAVSLGEVRLEIDGGIRNDLEVTALVDTSLTYSRSYQAVLEDYVLKLSEEQLLFRVFTPGGAEAGTREILVPTRLEITYSRYGNQISVTPELDIPPGADIRVDMDFPLFLESEPEILVDGVQPVDLRVEPSAQDSTNWIAEFKGPSTGGGHTITAESAEYSNTSLINVWGADFDLETFNFPNPFTSGTNIMFTLGLPADRASVKIYNVSGILIREFKISHEALSAAGRNSPNSIFWDGRDMAGNRVGNGTYIYVLDVVRGGEKISRDGKIVKLE